MKLGPEYPRSLQEVQELLNSSKEDLIKKYEVFSFDKERFEARMSSGEHWQLVIQAHLHLDHVISQTLLEALVKPEAINASRMGFAQKLQLIEALGLLPEFMFPSIEFVNGLRNKIAHNLKFEISEKDISGLTNVFPPTLMESLMRVSGRQLGPARLEEILEHIVVFVDLLRQTIAKERALNQKGWLEVGKRLHKLNEGKKKE